ncbi:S8 family serine peptidase [Bdellovibrio bacteriovorus]|uniref:S8 family serine peptidase n=1 Tax=Bdellovibrio bacteriovorus TaxID=959 RepID=UPI003A7FAD4B
MKFTFFSFLLVLSTSSQALAARAIVMMKDASAFQRTLSTRGTWSQSLPGTIEKSLPQLHTFIVDTENPADIERLKSAPGVAYVEKEYFHPAPPRISEGAVLANIDVVHPGTPWGLEAVKAPQAWSKSNKGEGIRVLVLDSGMNASHPSLAPNFERGRNFTGEDGINDFYDRTGHGTHVGGTIAAAEDGSGFSGVAPKAKLLAAKVCVDSGCSNTAIVAGISWGIDQGVDVMNLSLGSPSGSPAEKAALLRADQAGITVVAATGNYGINEVYFPASAPSVIAVGAVDKNLKHAVFSQYGPEVAVVAPGVQIVSTIPVGSGRFSTVTLNDTHGPQTLKAYHFKGTATPYLEQTRPVVDCGLGEPADFAGKDVKDKHVLVTLSGVTPIEDQIRNAMRAGATSVIVANNRPGLIETRLFEQDNVLFAVGFFVEQAEGEKIRAAIKRSPNTLVSLKSDLTSYKETFGTSMATPHVAGVAALVKAANKKLKPSEVKTLLIKTATPILPNDDNRYGSGLVNAQAAVDAAVEAR